MVRQSSKQRLPDGSTTVDRFSVCWLIFLCVLCAPLLGFRPCSNWQLRCVACAAGLINSGRRAQLHVVLLSCLASRLFHPDLWNWSLTPTGTSRLSACLCDYGDNLARLRERATLDRRTRLVVYNLVISLLMYPHCSP
jgi:hypothetical protein